MGIKGKFSTCFGSSLRKPFLAALIAIISTACARQTGVQGQPASSHAVSATVAQSDSPIVGASASLSATALDANGDATSYTLTCSSNGQGGYNSNSVVLTEAFGSSVNVADTTLATSSQTAWNGWTVTPNCSTIPQGGAYNTMLTVMSPSAQPTVFPLQVVQEDTAFFTAFSPSEGGTRSNPLILTGYECGSEDVSTVDYQLVFYINSTNSPVSEFQYLANSASSSGALTFGPASLGSPPANSSPYSSSAVIQGQIQAGEPMYSSFHIDCSKIQPGQEIDYAISAAITWANNPGQSGTGSQFTLKMTKDATPAPAPTPTPVPQSTPAPAPAAPAAPTCPANALDGAIIDCSIDFNTLAQVATGVPIIEQAPGALSKQTAVFTNEVYSGISYTIQFTPGSGPIWSTVQQGAGFARFRTGAAGDIPQVIGRPGQGAGYPVEAFFHGPTAEWTYGSSSTTFSGGNDSFAVYGSTQWGDGGDIPMVLSRAVAGTALDSTNAPLIGVFRPSTGQYIYSLDNNSWSGQNFGIIETGLVGGVPLSFNGSPTGQIAWEVLTKASGYQAAVLGYTNMVTQTAGSTVYSGQTVGAFQESVIGQYTPAQVASFFLTWGAIFQ